MKHITHLFAALFACSLAAFGQAPNTPTVGTHTDTGYTALTTTATAASPITGSVWVRGILCYSTVSTTFSITDAAGNLYFGGSAQPIAAGGTFVFAWPDPEGIRFAGGVKWSAAASGVSCHLTGNQ